MFTHGTQNHVKQTIIICVLIMGMVSIHPATFLVCFAFVFAYKDIYVAISPYYNIMQKLKHVIKEYCIALQSGIATMLLTEGPGYLKFLDL